MSHIFKVRCWEDFREMETEKKFSFCLHKGSCGDKRREKLHENTGAELCAWAPTFLGPHSGRMPWSWDLICPWCEAHPPLAIGAQLSLNFPRRQTPRTRRDLSLKGRVSWRCRRPHGFPLFPKTPEETSGIKSEKGGVLEVKHSSIPPMALKSPFQ